MIHPLHRRRITTAVRRQAYAAQVARIEAALDRAETALTRSTLGLR